jgi:quercetin dioxygenase-like cupin family protein
MSVIISEDGSPLAALGTNLVVHKWRGSGPGRMHVHLEDDECWHVLEGSLTFRLPEGEVIAPAGTTVFVPAGTPHDYYETDGSTSYLIIMPPRIDALIQELMQTPPSTHDEVFKKHASELL